ncbi:unnamed protein product [Aphanomyces euteiches]
MKDRLDLAEEAEMLVQDLIQMSLEQPSAKKQFFTGRRTKKKIEKAYDVLTSLDFPMHLIEEGLSHAHDVTAALQYLCLYHASADLPSRFRAYAQKSQVIKADDDETRPQLMLIPASAREDKGDSSEGHENIPLGVPIKSEELVDQDKHNAKAWTLQYLAMQENEDSPEYKMRQLRLELEQAKAEMKGLKKSKKRELAFWQAEVSRLENEINALQVSTSPATPQTPSLVAELITEAPKAEVEKDDEEDEDDDTGDLFSMLETTAATSVIAPVAVTKPNVVEVSTSVKWTGKTPRVQLQEYCQKQKWSPPQYMADSSRGKYNYSVNIKRGKQPTISATVPDIYATIDSAKDAVATRALYLLTPQLPLYRGFPPHFRDMWLTWVRQVEEEESKAKGDSAASKAAIIDGLFHLVPDNDPEQVETTSGTEEVPDAWDDEESWEDHVEDYVSTSSSEQRTPFPDTKFLQLMQSPKYKAMLPKRRTLPIAAYKQAIVQATQEHAVVLVSGETGSGKSTQVPHFLLEDMLGKNRDDGTILCTQPRRLAAIGVAERVAEEMGQTVGEGYVGYQIRLEQKKSAECKLVFCTTGVLLRQLQPNPRLDGVSCIVVDEIHERDVQCDILLGLLRRLVLAKPSLKLVLMSATLNAQLFQAYFSDCHLIAVPGRLFPVDKFYLEDAIELTRHVIPDNCRKNLNDGASSYSLNVTGCGGHVSKQILTWHDSDLRTDQVIDGPYSAHTIDMMNKVDPSSINYNLIEDLVAHLVENSLEGAILIFLSGRAEIRHLVDQLSASRSLASACVFLPLHAGLSTSEQHEVFNHFPNKTKVIVATNIAETSLTIDDVTVVIDTGRVKQMRHDIKTQTSSLKEVWIAKANADQRAGRAGRVQSGKCYRLYPQELYDQEMLAQPLAEIHRAPLTGLSLQLHTLVPENCTSFWNELLEPPTEQAVLDATAELTQLGALSPEDGTLTPLGHHLSKLPLDVRLAKMLLFAAVFGCTRPIAVIAALLETKSPFVSPFGQEKEAAAKRRLFQSDRNSDLLTDLNAFNAWIVLPKDKQDAFYKRHFLHRSALNEINQLASSFERLLHQLGFMDDSNRYANETAVISAVVAAGLYPNVVRVDTSEKGIVRLWERQKQVFIHPSSINHGAQFVTPWLGYHLKLHTSRVYLPVSSGVTPLALALFGGQFDVKIELSRVAIDTWLDLPCAGRTSMLLFELRRRLSDLLQRKLDAPSKMETDDRAVVDTIVTLWKLEM